MKTANLTLLALATLMSGCALQGGDKDRAEQHTQIYQCAGETSLSVTYFRYAGDIDRAMLGYEHDSIPMHQVASGSGARYVSDDEQLAYVWHAQEGEGMLYRENGEAERDILARDCQVDK
ncbi:membrane-bound inhibitor of C-type lysozyme [Chromohalobacter marismortui]|uniref:Membrane-bound inhibitor of C-type lysozyme n=1 Tax=Chromohalobacter marismortui TaxID=42055 RepID=A0A4R7NFH9_9GAMM|nr:MULTISPECIES: MliC family protein [Chromohalobacter]MCI0509413.1 MliC family protein [Chromohalobacter sp.]MCI0593034.1 MliC family protein [Chromohalobacter sp.]TDU19285.1 membrane-bound inhibitor of C-type lysozyme [Chromohalobacter marismortui]